MAVYSFRARDSHGRAQAGTLAADTPAEGRQLLRQRSWRLEQFGPAPLAGRRRTFGRDVARLWPGIRARRGQRVAEFARHLALLLRSGVPLAEALDVLIAQERSGRQSRAWQTVLRDLRDRIARGQTLSEAMSAHPSWFADLLLGAVRVGQEAGTLDATLAQLAVYLKDQQRLAARLTTALIYPAILLTLGVAVVVFLMSYVIPQLLTVLQASGKSLPAPTRLLKSVSDLLVAYWPGLLAAAVTLAVLGSALLRTGRGAHAWHRLQLRLPLLGPLLGKTLIARFAQQTAALLASAVPFTEALATVRRGTRHRVLAEELQALERAVEAGSDLAPALAGSRVFPPLVVHLVGVGQNAGELPQMLEQLRQGYETEVDLAVSRFTAALEPALIIVLAGLIGFVIFATMMPILEATRGIQ